MLYTEFGMKRIATTALVFLSLAFDLLGVEPQYQGAVLLSVERKINTRVLYYIVNTPITKDEPYYEVSLRLKDTLYIARYTPRHSNDTLPDGWKAGSSLQARVDGRYLFIQWPGEADWKLLITKRKAIKATEENPTPAPNP